MEMQRAERWGLGTGGLGPGGLGPGGLGPRGLGPGRVLFFLSRARGGTMDLAFAAGLAFWNHQSRVKHSPCFCLF